MTAKVNKLPSDPTERAAYLKLKEHAEKCRAAAMSRADTLASVESLIAQETKYASTFKPQWNRAKTRVTHEFKLDAGQEDDRARLF